MIFVHDIWANFSSGLEHAEYHEWHKSDSIMLIDQMPVVYIEDREMFSAMRRYVMEVPDTIMERVTGKAFIREANERIKFDTTFVLAVEDDAFIVHTKGTNLTKGKSELIPRQFRFVLSMLSDSLPEKHTWNPIPVDGDIAEELDTFYTFEQTLGLTRKEKERRVGLVYGIYNMVERDNHDELAYWLSEWTGEPMESYKRNRNNTLAKKIYETYLYGWTDKHETLLKAFAKADEDVREYLKTVEKEMPVAGTE